MSRNVFTIFSDDVRHEIGGKVSYIGSYSGKLYVPTFPTILSKLCLTLKVSTPTTKPFKKLVAKIYQDDELIATGEVPTSELESRAQNLATEVDSGPKKSFAFQMGFVFSPFEVAGPCFIRVRVETEDKELRGAGLRIDQAPPGMEMPPS